VSEQTTRDACALMFLFLCGTERIRDLIRPVRQKLALNGCRVADVASDIEQLMAHEDIQRALGVVLAEEVAAHG